MVSQAGTGSASQGFGDRSMIKHGLDIHARMYNVSAFLSEELFVSYTKCQGKVGQVRSTYFSYGFG